MIEWYYHFIAWFLYVNRIIQKFLIVFIHGPYVDDYKLRAKY